MPKQPKLKEPPQPPLTTRVLSAAASGGKRLLGIVLTLLGLLGALGVYAVWYPHVTIDPDRLLNPGDPFSTLFSVKNDNIIFSVRDFHPSCYTIYVVTDHNVGMMGLPPRPTTTIPVIEPQQKTTIDCPPWVGGLGAGTGNVVKAFIEIDASYKAGWFSRVDRFPFKGVINSAKSVYWTHITPAEVQADLGAPSAR